MNKYDEYDLCYSTGDYDGYDCELCPHKSDCSGYDDINEEDD